MARRNDVRSPEAAAADREYWEGGDQQITEVRKMGPQRVPGQQKPAPTHAKLPPVPLVREDVGAKQTLDAMCGVVNPEIGGTNPEKLLAARRWIDSEPKEPSAVELFHYLETSETRGEAPVARGTLEKLGRWLWGKQWRLAEAVNSTPAEEMRRLQDELARTRDQAREKTAEVIGLNQQVAFLSAQLRDRNLQLDYLKAGKSPAELATLASVSAAAGAAPIETPA